jgi:hypothetical protein
MEFLSRCLARLFLPIAVLLEAISIAGILIYVVICVILLLVMLLLCAPLAAFLLLAVKVHFDMEAILDESSSRDK